MPVCPLLPGFSRPGCSANSTTYCKGKVWGILLFQSFKKFKRRSLWLYLNSTFSQAPLLSLYFPQTPPILFPGLSDRAQVEKAGKEGFPAISPSSRPLSQNLRRGRDLRSRQLDVLCMEGDLSPTAPWCGQVTRPVSCRVAVGLCTPKTVLCPPVPEKCGGHLLCA